MILQKLSKHQWKAFKRHPMYERSMALKILTYFMFLFFGLYLFLIGFLIYGFLSKNGVYNNAIDSFNYILLYLFLFDFTLKYLAKKSQTMQLVPYLTLPIRRNTLFTFLLVKEFTNMWNSYFIFMLVSFAFKAIPPYYGYAGVFFYLLFFYILSIGNSLLVNIANRLSNRSGWYLFLPIIIVSAIVGITFIPGVNIEVGIVQACAYILEKNIMAWIIILLVVGALWKINISMMNVELYKDLQGRMVSVAGTSFNLPFIDRLGAIGKMINLEIKMILRSRRVKFQMYMLIFCTIYYILIIINTTIFREVLFQQLFFTIFMIGGLGAIMAQFIFTYESSFFDGLMTRKISLLDILKAKYILYCSYSILFFAVLMIFVFTGTLDFLFLISVFFYATGLFYFLMFQNAVYNKCYYNHSDSIFFNWKGQSSRMWMISSFSLFVPVVFVLILEAIFSETIANYFMLITGITFTFTAKYWLTWIYNRFLKRKYTNMEGFRNTI